MSEAVTLARIAHAINSVETDRWPLSPGDFERVLRMLLIALKQLNGFNAHQAQARIAHAINSVETVVSPSLALNEYARIAHAINSVETCTSGCCVEGTCARIAHAINSVET